MTVAVRRPTLRGMSRCLLTHAPRQPLRYTGAPPDDRDHPRQRIWPAAPHTSTAYAPTIIFFMVDDGRAMDLRSNSDSLGTTQEPLRGCHSTCLRPGAAPTAPLRPSGSLRSPYLQYRTPYAQRMCFVPPCFHLPRGARSPPAFPPQNPFLVLRPSIRNAVFNGQFTATARSREPSIQHGYPSHALPRNDAPPCHVSCLRPGNAPRLRSPLLTSLTGSATLPFRTRLRLAGHRLTPVPVHPPA